MERDVGVCYQGERSMAVRGKDVLKNYCCSIFCRANKRQRGTKNISKIRVECGAWACVKNLFPTILSDRTYIPTKATKT